MWKLEHDWFVNLNVINDKSWGRWEGVGNALWWIWRRQIGGSNTWSFSHEFRVSNCLICVRGKPRWYKVKWFPRKESGVDPEAPAIATPGGYQSAAKCLKSPTNWWYVEKPGQRRHTRQRFFWHCCSFPRIHATHHLNHTINKCIRQRRKGRRTQQWFNQFSSFWCIRTRHLSFRPLHEVQTSANDRNDEE